MQNIVPNFKNLNSHPPGTNTSIALPRADRAKNTAQKKTTPGKDYSFLFVDAKFGGAGGAYNGSGNKKKKDDKYKQKWED